MTTDFQKLAAEGKANLLRRQKEDSDKRAAETMARSAAVDAAVGALDKRVVPILRDAVKSFAAEDMEFSITTNYDVKNFVSRAPSIKFQGHGPRRKQDGYRFDARAVFFSSPDGTSITAGVAEHGFDTDPKTHLGTVPAEASGELIEMAVKRALENYLAELAKRSG